MMSFNSTCFHFLWLVMQRNGYIFAKVIAWQHGTRWWTSFLLNTNLSIIIELAVNILVFISMPTLVKIYVMVVFICFIFHLLLPIGQLKQFVIFTTNIIIIIVADRVMIDLYMDILVILSTNLVCLFHSTFSVYFIKWIRVG